MTDRRTLRSSGRVAHSSLRGQVEAETFTEGDPRLVCATVADLCSSPGGPRDRQLLRGEVFHVLDQKGDQVFGFAEKDGYAGWLSAASLAAEGAAPTHVVTSARSYAKTTPGLKTMGQITPLPFGARLTVQDDTGDWSRIIWTNGPAPAHRYVPSQHLAALPHRATDPVTQAEKLIGTPYLWGGNSSFGIDCSGLVQAALLACGIPCPGDSDQQEAALGKALPTGTPAQRGDLFFWKGHVAMAVDDRTLVHANAHHMAVTCEGLGDAISRIAAQGDGPVTSHRRIA